MKHIWEEVMTVTEVKCWKTDGVVVVVNNLR
jgi:hypothetical protein